MTRRLAVCASLLVLACCGLSPGADAPKALGDFRLGYNVVQANDVQAGPFSRQVAPEDLTAALEQAVEARLSRYDGDGLYHLGIAIGGYVLAQPGLPVVYTPKSVLIFEVNVYDNATGRRLNDTPKRIIAFEGARNVTPVLGSGIVRTGPEQLANLAAEGARLVELWLAQNPDWFAPTPGAVRVAFDRDAARQRVESAIAASRGTGPR